MTCRKNTQEMLPEGKFQCCMHIWNNTVPKARGSFYILPGFHTSVSLPKHIFHYCLICKRFFIPFSLLHTSPLPPSSAPRCATSQLFSPGCKGLGANLLIFTPALNCSTQHTYRTALNAFKCVSPPFSWILQGGCRAEPGLREAY